MADETGDQGPMVWLYVGILLLILFGLAANA